MRRTLQLAATALLFAATASVRAQIQNDDVLGPKAPRNPADRKTLANLKPGSHEWLWSFTQPGPNGRANDLLIDSRFESLLLDNFHQPQAMWGNDNARPSLAQVITLFLGKYGEALSEDNRYFIADGCVPSFCPASGLLWIDLSARHPLMIFAARNWSTTGHSTDEANANYHLWLFANRNITPDALPFAFKQSLAHWDMRLAAAHRGVPHIQRAILVEPDGSALPLEPADVGANVVAAQPDTVTPQPTDND
ncbi:hypothetical protein ACFQBQ_05255 [Granulicella cerasi]|uniref:Uncharacterized protein n=1 Tax=Granulicella cerasi TaxID=741063 RepID=A0ABW1Z776_9BACT|nr:hypothetical protein [Granulicella cerasi]